MGVGVKVGVGVVFLVDFYNFVDQREEGVEFMAGKQVSRGLFEVEVTKNEGYDAWDRAPYDQRTPIP